MSSVATGRSTFLSPPLALKPAKICAGRVTAVGDAYLSKPKPNGGGEKYYVVKITLTALGAGTDKDIWFLFRPEYFNAAMTRADLNDMAEADKGVYRMYEQHICTSEEGKKSTLQGLAGSQEAFNELASRLLAIGVDAIAEQPTLVSDVLRQFFIEENPQAIVGYVLGQQTEKTDEIDPETGKNIYVPSKWLEVKSYWEVNDKTLAAKARLAEKSPSRYTLCYAGESF
jgi:hypothetical protein